MSGTFQCEKCHIIWFLLCENGTNYRHYRTYCILSFANIVTCLSTVTMNINWHKSFVLKLQLSAHFQSLHRESFLALHFWVPKGRIFIRGCGDVFLYFWSFPRKFHLWSKIWKGSSRSRLVQIRSKIKVSVSKFRCKVYSSIQKLDPVLFMVLSNWSLRE